MIPEPKNDEQLLLIGLKVGHLVADCSVQQMSNLILAKEANPDHAFDFGKESDEMIAACLRRAAELFKPTDEKERERVATTVALCFTGLMRNILTEGAKDPASLNPQGQISGRFLYRKFVERRDRLAMDIKKLEDKINATKE